MKHKVIKGTAKGSKMSMNKMGATSTKLFGDKGMGKTYKPGKDTPRISKA